MDVQLLIPRVPAIYPAGFLIRFRLVRLAAACSCCIALRKQLCFKSATQGAGLSRPGDPATGPVGARRWGLAARINQDILGYLCWIFDWISYG